MTTTQDTYIAELVENFTFPVQESVIAELLAALAAELIDFQHIENLITNDVSLSAAVLQTANSPMYAQYRENGEQFTSLNSAIGCLGIEKLSHLINTINLQEKYHQTGNNLSRYWDSAVDVAIVSSYLSEKLTLNLNEEAYEAGLFRDCGLPVMLQGIPDYKEFLFQANRQPDITLAEQELEKFNITHQMVGYQLALKWELPEVICNVIKEYPNMANPVTIDNSNLLELNKNILICIVVIAENVSDKFRSMTRRVDSQQITWDKISPYIPQYLGLSIEELVELMEETVDNMENLLTAHER